jgi:hypothetical protein
MKVEVEEQEQHSMRERIMDMIVAVRDFFAPGLSSSHGPLTDEEEDECFKILEKQTASAMARPPFSNEQWHDEFVKPLFDAARKRTAKDANESKGPGQGPRSPTQ